LNKAAKVAHSGNVIKEPRFQFQQQQRELGRNRKLENEGRSRLELAGAGVYGIQSEKLSAWWMICKTPETAARRLPRKSRAAAARQESPNCGAALGHTAGQRGAGSWRRVVGLLAFGQAGLFFKRD